VDPLSTEIAMNRMLNLLQSDSPGCEILSGTVDVHGKLPPSFTLLRVSVDAINQLLGITLSAQQMAGILKRLDLPTEIRRDDLVVKIPSYRKDITGMPDIAEEILRLQGSDQIPFIMPVVSSKPFEMPEIEQLKKRIRDLMVRLKFTEVYTHPFDAINSDDKIPLLNPLSEHWTYLVDDLSPGLLALEINRPSYRVFELSTTFRDAKDILPVEQQQLACLLHESDAYRAARGAADIFIDELGLNGGWEEYLNYAGLQFKIDGHYVGHIKAHSENRAEVSFNVSQLLPYIAPAKQFIEMSKFPALKMDIAFIVKPEVRIGELQKTIQGVGRLVSKVELFDVFELSEQQRNVAFHIELRAEDRTLTGEERDAIHARIVEAAKETFGATLRE
jgi:phenylalanyl-tRNA synthetase beta chain